MSDADNTLPKAVVLVSGGLDSCVCVAETRRKFEIAALHLNYGQRTERCELQAFTDLADHYGIRERLVCNLDHLAQIGGTSLIDTSLEVEKGLPDGSCVPSTYVPFRNAHILSIGVSWAEVIGAEAVVIGAVEEDGSGYPDCTAAFYEAFSRTVAAGTRPNTRIEIRTPLLHLDKAGIVRRGRELDAPFHLTWSCYVDDDVACGECESCRLRLRGFETAGVIDPLPYR